METVPLTFCNGHFFVAVEDRDWLVDTGAPSSFGAVASLAVDDKVFRPRASYMGLTADTVSEYTGHPTAGVMGADVLNEFDVLLDAPRGRHRSLGCCQKFAGTVVGTEEFMGIPVVQARIGGTTRRMFFDTGAHVSYYQDEALTTFPAAGRVTDFYPGVGRFETETYLVGIALGGTRYTLRCGRLPSLLGMALMMANIEGIIGNEILRDRAVGVLPRRRQLVFK